MYLSCWFKQLVPDVHLFPGHIACDAASNSEIVVPVFDNAGQVLAVLDLDSVVFSGFDSEDQHYLEQISQMGYLFLFNHYLITF